MGSAYTAPDAAMTALMDAPRTPTLAVDPTDTVALQLTPGGMPSIEELALSELKLGGLRFSPDLLFPTRMDSNGGKGGSEPALVVLPRAGSSDVSQLPFSGLPSGYSMSYVTWSKAGGKCAFMGRPGGTPTAPYELWVAEWDAAAPTSVAARQLLPDARFNAVTGPPFVWSPDGEKLVVKVVPTSLGPLPAAPPAPPGPTIQDNSEGDETAAATYQDMISSPNDELLFAHCSTAALQLLDVATGSCLPIGPSEGMMLRGSHAPSNSGSVDGALSVSPSGAYIMAQRFTTPFSYTQQFSKFGYVTMVFDADTGKLASEVYASPLQEAVPTHTDGCVTGPRQIRFHPSLPATLVYASAADAGDPLASMDGPRDELYFLEAPFNMANATLKLKMDLRYSSMTFVENGDVIATEQRWSDRLLREWRVAQDGEPQLLSERSSENRYANPGTPLLNGKGMAACSDGATVLLSGLGASDFGDRPFLDTMNLDDGSTTRLWRSPAGPDETGDSSAPGVFESPVAMLTDNRVLIERESNTMSPNYYIVALDSGDETELTAYPHPQPDLTGITKQLIKYKRDDGVGLTADLYLPADFVPGESKPLPCLMWAYPREFKDAASASQIRDSPFRFWRIDWKGPLFMLAKGWAVLDGPAFPILGLGDAEPNDTFKEQLVGSAAAAIDAVVDMGVADRNKMAVGGHSYGAFMTSHLLSHTDLFKAGLARSGGKYTINPHHGLVSRDTYGEVACAYSVQPIVDAIWLPVGAAHLLE